MTSTLDQACRPRTFPDPTVKESHATQNHHATSVIARAADVASSARIGCFVHICSGAKIGHAVVIEGLTMIPANVHVHEGARIGHGASFVGPVSEAHPTVIARGADIGERAIIHSGVSIGERAVIAPGSLVKRSIPSMAIVEGSPARIIGYVDAGGNESLPDVSSKEAVQASRVRGVQLHHMLRVVDIRGNLTAGEFERRIPFQVKRYFMVFDVPSAETRGEHAHRECHQFLICVRGECAVVADDGFNRHEFRLDQPDIGVYLPPMVWGIQYKYSADAVLMVFASHYYDSADYIRSYADFRREVGATS